MSEHPVHAPKGDVKLPGLGPVPKKWFLIVGGGAVVTVAYVLYKRRKGAAPAAATADPAVVAGQPCVDSNGNPGVYDASGTCQANAGTAGGYYAGTGAGGVSGVTPPVPGTGGFTTNGQWSQQAQTDLANTGIDPAALATALGAYLTGQPLTSAQQQLVDSAIADEGYPPVAGPSGYPPAMHVTATGTGGGTPPPPPGGGTGGTPPPVRGSWKFPAPTGLHASAISDSGYSLTWNPVTGPSGQHPTGYTVATYDAHGKQVDQFTSGATSTKEYGAGGRGLTPGGHYHTNVWANGAPVAPSHASVTVTVLAKGKR